MNSKQTTNKTTPVVADNDVIQESVIIFDDIHTYWAAGHMDGFSVPFSPLLVCGLVCAIMSSRNVTPVKVPAV